MFENSFDPMALTLSDEEKQRMVKDLSADKRDESADEPSPARGGVPRKQTHSTDEDSGFFAYLWRLLHMIFTGTRPSDYELQRKLRALRNEVKRIKPPIMTFSPDQITGEVARQIHVLYQYLAPLVPLFDDTVANSDPEGSFNFQMYYFQQILPSIGNEFGKFFTEDGLLSFIEGVRDDMARGRVREKTESYINLVEENDRKQINTLFSDILAIHELIHFKFPIVLRRFSPDYSVDSRTNIFNDVRTDNDVAEDLKALESLLLSVELERLRDVLILVGDYFREYLREKMDEQYVEKITGHLTRIGMKNYSGLGVTLARVVSGGQLTLIVRYITRSRDYTPRVHNRVSNFFDDFTKNIKRVVDVRLERAIVRRRREAIGSDMTALFGGTEPIPGFFYTAETNVILCRMEMSSFIYTEAFYINMRFYTEIFPEHVKRTLDKLIVEGSYIDSLVRRVLSEEFYRSVEITERLIRFSEFINMKTERGSILYGMIQKFKGNAVAKKALAGRIATVNEGLHPILLAIRENAHNLHDALGRVAADVGASQPKVMDNLAKIGTQGNSRFLTELRKSVQDCALLVRLNEETFREGA